MNLGPGLIRGPARASMELTKHLQGTTDDYRLLFSWKLEVGIKEHSRLKELERFYKVSRAGVPGSESWCCLDPPNLSLWEVASSSSSRPSCCPFDDLAHSCYATVPLKKTRSVAALIDVLQPPEGLLYQAHCLFK